MVEISSSRATLPSPRPAVYDYKDNKIIEIQSKEAIFDGYLADVFFNILNIGKECGDNMHASTIRPIVSTSVELASLATYGCERPPPSPHSKIHAYQEYNCKFCKATEKCDGFGGCAVCGLGAHIWKETE